MLKMRRIIETNEIKEEFDGVLETPLANFLFDFDVSTTTGTNNNSNSQFSSENYDQNRTAKSDSTNNDGSMTEGKDVEEDNVTKKDDRDDKKVKVRYLNCTQPNCDHKLDTLDQFRKHLRKQHGLSPFPCFCGCKCRFDQSWQISRHLQNRLAKSKFSCPVCAKVFSTQGKTNRHWLLNHLTGQFECNIDDCAKVADTQNRLANQQRKHCPETNRLKCPVDGCSSSFTSNSDLKLHQFVHLNTKPFHCKWPKCVHSTYDRSNLIRHIQGIHFEKLRQQKNGIVGERDSKKYVRVVKK